MKTRAAPVLVGSVQTDDWGYACFRGLMPGTFVLCAPGAEPTDRVPHAVRIVLPQDMPITEMATTLVIPEQLRALQIEVDASFARKPSLRPSVYLRRIGGSTDGELYPIRGVMQPGTHKTEMRVPIGEYEVGVLPLGAFEVLEGGSIDARAEKVPELHVRVQAVRAQLTEITLDGLKRQHFPVSVYPRQVNEMLGGNPELLYMGRYRWHLPTAKVMAPSQACHLVVSNRTESWISKSTFKFQGGSTRVPLIAATRLTIHWHTDEIAKGLGAMVSLKTAGETYWRLLQPMLIEAKGCSLPTLVGRIIVPRGKVALECSLPSGKQAWQRRVEAMAPFQTVEVEND